MTPLTESQFRALVEQFVEAQGDEWMAARALGERQSYLKDFLIGRHGPGPNIAAYFGLVPEVRYVRRENKE